jgi:glycosyltransferase involved in cell wall biosynthesis
MPPRILFINNVSILGAGTSRSLLLLIRHLRSTYDSAVVLDEGSGRLPEVLKEEGIPCYVLPRRTWRYLPSLLWLIIRGRYNLLYGNSYFSRATNGAWLAALTRRPFIWHIRETITERSPKRPLWLAAAIIANSDDTAQRVKRSAPYVADKVVTIGNGVDLTQFELNQSEVKCKGRGIMGIPLADLVIINVGLVCARKNQQAALEAAAVVMKQRPEVHLCFLGQVVEPAYASSLEQRAKDLGLADRVHLLGETADVPSYLCASDVLLHTAEKEPQGRVILEAMAARLPVVAYDVGGIHEALVHEETGFLVPFGDIPAVVGALRRLVEHPELRRTLGESGYSRVRAHFTAEGAARQVQQVIKRVLKKLSAG